MSEAGAWRRWKSLYLAFFFPLNTLVFALTGPHSGWVAALFMIPLMGFVALDRLPVKEANGPDPTVPAAAFDVLLVTLAILQIANVVLTARMFSETSVFSVDAFVALSVVGASSGFSGMVIAHELIHRHNRWLRWVGRVVLASSMYEHYYTEHLRGHHVRVGTAEDPSTAKFGETFWAFFRRTVPGQFKSAWHLERQRVGARWWRNEVIRGLAMSTGLALALFVLYGPVALVMHLSCALVAIRGLEAANYLEHWGLQRAPNAPQDETLSWDSPSWFTYYSMFGLSRHADHHMAASKGFQLLQLREGSPQLPYGYAAMVIMAFSDNRRFQELMTAELKAKSLGPFAQRSQGDNRQEASTGTGTLVLD